MSNPTLDDLAGNTDLGSLGYVRKARKQWRCVCADPTWPGGAVNGNHALQSADCRGDILPRIRYFEYMGEAEPFAHGDAYCEPCALAMWGKYVTPRQVTAS